MTVLNDPQQEIFTTLKQDLETLGFDVYDGALPPDEAPYPFVYLGDCRQSDESNKSAVFGYVYLTIHVWHCNPKQRGTASQMLLAIKTACRNIGRTESFAWMLLNADQRIFADNTTKTPLLHGVLEAEWKFS